MQNLIKCSIGALQVEQQLSDLRLGQLVRGLHGIQRAQPLVYLLFALKVAGQDAESVHCVHQIADLRMQVIHRSYIQTQLVHDGDEQGHNVRNALARIAFVVLDGDRSVLLNTLEGRGAVQLKNSAGHPDATKPGDSYPILLDKCVNGRKLVALHLPEPGLVLHQ